MLLLLCHQIWGSFFCISQQERSDSNTVHRLWRPSPLPGEHSCMAEAQRTELLRLLIFELYYPVGFANELGPALHTIHSIGVDRLPSWTHWLLAKLHMRLSWSTVRLLRIAITGFAKLAAKVAVGRTNYPLGKLLAISARKPR